LAGAESARGGLSQIPAEMDQIKVKKAEKKTRVSHVVPEWYHFAMAMNLRLSQEQSDALKKAAGEDGISMQEAALRAIELYSSRRRSILLESIEKIKSEDSELLKRLAE
jgi:predicted DNA binding CopG/RHH family protein